MMQVLIFSDSHGDTSRLREALLRHPTAAAVCHLGDGAREAETIPAILPTAMLFAVRGNCDISSDAPDTDIVPLGPVKAFICHGHTYGVEYGRLDSLVYAAQEAGAKIAMFGHTHEAYYGEAGGVQLLNPGTAGKGRTLTWAVVIVFDNGAIACEIKEL